MGLGAEFFWIGHFAWLAWEHTNSCPSRLVVTVVTMWIMVALNIWVFVYDAKLNRDVHLSFFIGSIVLRAILLPTVVYFHPLIGFIHKCRDAVLIWSLRISTVVAVVSMIGVLIAKGTVGGYLDAVRLSQLPPLSPNWTRTPSFVSDAPICRAEYQGIELIQTLGLACGGYDVDRDVDLFERELQYFFGPNESTFVSYSVRYLMPDVPLLVYNISGTTVFAFRGFATGRELAIQAELIARHYATPFLTDVLPLYSVLSEYLVSYFTKLAYLFGAHWFNPTSPFDIALRKAQEIYDSYGLEKKEDVLFVGVNVGGVLAKVMGLLNHRRGIGFLSLPSGDDDVSYRYAFDATNKQFVSNIFNLGGIFGIDDPDSGENLGIPNDFDILDTDSVYQSFCGLVVMCGRHQQFKAYCTELIGAEKFEDILDSITPLNPD
jgi:hypothetical protein